MAEAGEEESMKTESLGDPGEDQDSEEEDSHDKIEGQVEEDLATVSALKGDQEEEEHDSQSKKGDQIRSEGAEQPPNDPTAIPCPVGKGRLLGWSNGWQMSKWQHLQQKYQEVFKVMEKEAEKTRTEMEDEYGEGFWEQDSQIEETKICLPDGWQRFWERRDTTRAREASRFQGLLKFERKLMEARNILESQQERDIALQAIEGKKVEEEEQAAKKKKEKKEEKKRKEAVQTLMEQTGSNERVCTGVLKMHMRPGMSILQAYIEAKQMLTGDAGIGNVPGANAGLGEPATEAAEETECTVCDTLTTRRNTILHMRQEAIEEGVEIECKKKESKYDQERMDQIRGTMEALHQAERAIEVQIKSHNKRKKVEKKEKRKRRKLEKKGAAAAMGTNISSVSDTGGTRPMEPDQEPDQEPKKEEEVNDERAARRNKHKVPKAKALKNDEEKKAKKKKAATDKAGPSGYTTAQQ